MVQLSTKIPEMLFVYKIGRRSRKGAFWIAKI